MKMETEIEENLQEIKDRNNGLLGEIVNKYYGMIKPALKRGNFIGANIIITESNVKLGLILEDVEGNRLDDASQRVNGVYWNCKGALSYLNEVINNNLTGNKLEESLYQAEKRFERMDKALKNDPVYRECRGFED